LGLGATAHNPPDPHWFLFNSFRGGGLPGAGTYKPPPSIMLAVSSLPAESFLFLFLKKKKKEKTTQAVKATPHID
jgi:hypothetical protein